MNDLLAASSSTTRGLQHWQPGFTYSGTIASNSEISDRLVEENRATSGEKFQEPQK